MSSATSLLGDSALRAWLWTSASEFSAQGFPHLDDPRLQREIQLVRESGLLDTDYYRAMHPGMVERAKQRGVEPDEAAHFCQLGWRHLSRPRADFDTWWYWSHHLDPAQELINPLVHYLLAGRDAGLATRPGPVRLYSTTTLPAQPRRVCLFAGYDAQGLIDDFVVDYVRELARFCDVYYLSDGFLGDEELAKLDGIAVGAWSHGHQSYDFGSYARLARDYVGWETLETYDELLLVNDSCFLLRPLDEVFSIMAARSCDWWGLQATKGMASTQDPDADLSATAQAEPISMETVRAELLDEFELDDVYDFHVGSYFLAYRRPVVSNPRFRRLLESAGVRQRGKLGIVRKFEIGLTHLLISDGHTLDTFISHLYPFHPLFTENYFRLLESGFPLLKRYLLYMNHYDVPDLYRWKERVVASVEDAPVEMLERSLNRTSPADRLARSMAVRTDADGRVTEPKTLLGRDFKRLDRTTPVHVHWWAFPVSTVDDQLPAASRAIFDEVAHDPSIKKILLTRSVEIQLDGTNVVSASLISPQGQEHLARAGHVFVDRESRETLSVPLNPSEHRIVVVRRGLSLVREGPARVQRSRPLREPRRRFDVLLTSSDLDEIGALADNFPAIHGDAWRTGLPGQDLVLRDHERLPADLREQEREVRARVGARRLLLVVPASGSSSPSGAYAFTRSQVARLARWCERERVVVGLREHVSDRDRTYRRLLSPMGPHLIDLNAPVTHDRTVLMRVADAVLTDHDGMGAEFLVTGRPVICFEPHLERVDADLLFPLDHVFPDKINTTVDDLQHSLRSVFDGRDEAAQRRYERARGTLVEHLDDQSARRVVRQLREERVTGSVDLTRPPRGGRR